MRQSEFIIKIVEEKYSEWLEMAGEQSPACKADFLADILACLLGKEIEKNVHYRQLLKKREEPL